jgi:hypothetical protein
MEIKTVHGNTIKKMIDNINSLLKTVDIRFYPEGIYVCAADLAKYMLINISLYAENFSKYYCPARFRITLDIGALNNALLSIDSYETLSFIFETHMDKNLFLLMETKNSRTNRVTLYGMSGEKKVYKVPKQKFDKPMVFESRAFQQDVRSMCFYAAMILFATDYKSFHMIASGVSGCSHLVLQPEKKSEEEIEKTKLTDEVQQPNEESNEESNVDFENLGLSTEDSLEKNNTQQDGEIEERTNKLNDLGENSSNIPTENISENARVRATNFENSLTLLIERKSKKES